MPPADAPPAATGRPLVRAAALALGVAWAVWCAWAVADPGGISWHWFVDGSHWLAVDGLSVFGRHPELQVGPLSLLLAGGAVAVAGGHALLVVQVGSTACLGVVGWALTRLLPESPTRWQLAGLGVGWAVLAPAWAVLAVRWVHPDDVLALTLLAVVVAVVARPGRRAEVVAAVLVVLAVAAKPWAVVGRAAAPRPPEAPVARGGPGRRRDRRRVAAVPPRVPGRRGGPGTAGARLAHLVPRVARQPGRRRRAAVGPPGAAPRWGPRGARRGAARPVGRRPARGARVRLLLDPQNLAYYAAGAVLVALVADLASRRWWLPVRALVTAAVFWQPFVPDFATRLSTTDGLAHWWFAHPGTVAWVHAVWAVLAIGDALLWMPRTPPTEEP